MNIFRKHIEPPNINKLSYSIFYLERSSEFIGSEESGGSSTGWNGLVSGEFGSCDAIFSAF
jgi:hypothetical protein